MDKSRIKIKTIIGKSFTVSNDHRAQVFLTGNVVEIITVKKPPSSNISRFRRLNKDSYVDQDTGEIVKYKQHIKRSDNHSGLRKTFRQLRRIINANFVGENNSEKHIILTYGYIELDYIKAAHDFSRFWARFKYYFPGCEYIRILEPQHSGRWHIHLLVKKGDGTSLYIDYKQLHDIWGLGMIYVSKMPPSDNFGAYFSAMFTDCDIFENAECQERDPKAWKMIEKGARFKYYPPSFRFFSCSKGIIRPKAVTMSYSDAKNLVSNSREVYSYTKQIMDKDESGNSVELNAILYEQFNSKRNHK